MIPFCNTLSLKTSEKNCVCVVEFALADALFCIVTSLFPGALHGIMSRRRKNYVDASASLCWGPHIPAIISSFLNIYSI